ncbi:HlyD family secretion protein [Rhodopirellula halodulae]|uniref:HlyD family secretion protein n=1 Tax=Rhodopirellula halodulae TaxID=2894198 RepID=UPI001E608675|nr:HlyD family secretion protein [Rhodopirellula sp. JC737]MCC9656773.1 HlyD family secretion protein [Rhodopirellula sp. JC737]
MSWILGGLYCGAVWLIFAKFKLLRLTLPLAVFLASVGPGLIIALLFCAQYFHPYTKHAIVIAQIDPITAQLSTNGRIQEVFVSANDPVKKGDVLFTVDPVPYENAVQLAQANLTQAKQSIELSESTVELAKATLDRATADLRYATNDRDRYRKLRESGGASQDELERAETQFQQADAALTQAEQSLKQAQISVGVAQAKQSQAETSLANAEYDLEQTTVRAPADGYVTNLQVHPGMLLGPATGPVMSFIRDFDQEHDGIVVALFTEKNFLRIQPNQYAELAMDAYPGEILTGRVLNAINVSGKGQLTAGGVVPSSVSDGKPSQFAVRIRLDDPESYPMPGGAQGQAAVYTGDVQIAGIPIMFVIRANSWMNYVF